MWSVYFGFVASYYMGWLGYDIVVSIIVHMIVIIPVGFTNAIFMDNERMHHGYTNGNSRI